MCLKSQIDTNRIDEIITVEIKSFISKEDSFGRTIKRHQK